MTDNKTKQVISKELEKKLTQEYGRLSFRDKLMLIYAVSETTQELKKMCKDLEKENKRLRERIEFSDFRG